MNRILPQEENANYVTFALARGGTLGLNKKLRLRGCAGVGIKCKSVGLSCEWANMKIAN